MKFSATPDTIAITSPNIPVFTPNIAVLLFLSHVPILEEVVLTLLLLLLLTAAVEVVVISPTPSPQSFPPPTPQGFVDPRCRSDHCLVKIRHHHCIFRICIRIRIFICLRLGTPNLDGQKITGCRICMRNILPPFVVVVLLLIVVIVLIIPSYGSTTFFVKLLSPSSSPRLQLPKMLLGWQRFCPRCQREIVPP